MKLVGKYNLYKGISTLLTAGTPIIALASCSDLFVHRPDTAVSAAGVFAFLFAMLFAKDKIAENFKMPSPFIISIVGLIAICMIESILYPLKVVFVSTIVASGVDIVTFRQMYKAIENKYSESFSSYKRFGFVFAKTETVIGE